MPGVASEVTISGTEGQPAVRNRGRGSLDVGAVEVAGRGRAALAMGFTIKLVEHSCPALQFLAPSDAAVYLISRSS